MLRGAPSTRQSFHSSKASIYKRTQRVVRLRNKVGDGKKMVLSLIKQHRHIIKLQHHMQPCKRMIESFMYRYDPPLRMTLPDVGRFFTAKTNLAPNSSKPNPTQRKCLWIETTIPQKSSYTGNEWWINYRNLPAIPSLYMLKKCI